MLSIRICLSPVKCSLVRLVLPQTTAQAQTTVTGVRHSEWFHAPFDVLDHWNEWTPSPRRRADGFASCLTELSHFLSPDGRTVAVVTDLLTRWTTCHTSITRRAGTGDQVSRVVVLCLYWIQQHPDTSGQCLQQRAKKKDQMWHLNFHHKNLLANLHMHIFVNTKWSNSVELDPRRFKSMKGLEPM